MPIGLTGLIRKIAQSLQHFREIARIKIITRVKDFRLSPRVQGFLSQTKNERERILLHSLILSALAGIIIWIYDALRND